MTEFKFTVDRNSIVCAPHDSPDDNQYFYSVDQFKIKKRDDTFYIDGFDKKTQLILKTHVDDEEDIVFVISRNFKISTLDKIRLVLKSSVIFWSIVFLVREFVYQYL